MVSVMTLHAAKGLEFDTVFLPGWEEGLFPNQRALDDKGLAGLEEERRLAYVGLTRARKRAYVSFAANRRVFNQWQAAIPSRFLKELPTAQLAESSDAGLYATYSAGHHGGLRDQASGFDYESLGVTGVGPRPHALARRDVRRPPRGRGRQARPQRRPARLPPEVRLRPHRRGRRQQARHRVREGRPEEGPGQLHRSGLSGWTAWRDRARPIGALARGAGARTPRRDGLRRHQPRGLARRPVADRDLRRGRPAAQLDGELDVGGAARQGLGRREPALVPALPGRAVLGPSQPRPRRHAGRAAADRDRCRHGLRHRHACHHARLPGDAGDARSGRDRRTPSMSAAAAASSPSPWPSCGSGRCGAATTMPQAVEVAIENAGAERRGAALPLRHLDRPATRRNWRGARPTT